MLKDLYRAVEGREFPRPAQFRGSPAVLLAQASGEILGYWTREG